MPIQHHEHQQQSYPFFLLDALYCQEDGVAQVSEEEDSSSSSNNGGTRSFFPLLLEQDLFLEDDELLSLFSKEEDEFLTLSRREVRREPWLIQLVAVTCLSLAAKVEETHVPLLLDLQVEGTRYVFEAKTVQRMELLVLSTLQWKMHPITPFSFLDHITTRLGLNTHFHRELLGRCARLLLRVISDSRSVLYLPSVLATATMMHVIGQVQTNQLLSVLKISKEKVNDCNKLILDVSAGFCSDSSNESWVVGPSPSPSLSSPEPPFKRRAQEQGMRLASVHRVLVDIVGNESSP